MKKRRQEERRRIFKKKNRGGGSNVQLFISSIGDFMPTIVFLRQGQATDDANKGAP
jgi:hypothetical protein